MKQYSSGGRTNSPKLFIKSNTLTKATFSSVPKLSTMDDMFPKATPLSKWTTRNDNKEKIKPKILNYFDVLGFDHDSTVLYRKKLSSIMFS